MSLDDLKRKLDKLSGEERHSVLSYLISLRDRDDANCMRKMARKIDAKDSSHWITFEEIEKRLSQGKYDTGK